MDRQRAGVQIGWASILLNVILFGLKLWAAVLTGSVAMVADAWHTLADSLTSVIVLVGFSMGARPADREHPFGHGRAEVIAAVVIGTLLAVVSVGFGREAVLRLVHHETASYSTLAAVVFAASTLLKEALARWSIRVGRRIEAPALVADGWHHRSDAIASGVIVVGVLLGPRFWWMDGVLGIAVALLIMHAAWEVIRDAADDLMGGTPSPALEDRVRAIIAAEAPAGCAPHHLHLHHYGVHRELTLHLYLDPAMSVRQAHDIADRVEAALMEQLGIHATVHVDPDDAELREREGEAG